MADGHDLKKIAMLLFLLQPNLMFTWKTQSRWRPDSVCVRAYSIVVLACIEYFSVEMQHVYLCMKTIQNACSSLLIDLFTLFQTLLCGFLFIVTKKMLLWSLSYRINLFCPNLISSHSQPKPQWPSLPTLVFALKFDLVIIIHHVEHKMTYQWITSPSCIMELMWGECGGSVCLCG